MEEIEKSGFANYYVDHTVGVWPQAASGFPFTAAQFQVTGDPITDLMEDMAADATTLKEQLEDLDRISCFLNCKFYDIAN